LHNNFGNPTNRECQLACDVFHGLCKDAIEAKLNNSIRSRRPVCRCPRSSHELEQRETRNGEHISYLGIYIRLGQGRTDYLLRRFSRQKDRGHHVCPRGSEAAAQQAV
jgi:hypothetical protein